MSATTKISVDADFSKDSFEDLVLLKDLSVNGVTDALKARFEKDQIYTKIGNVLISVNPFRDISGAYAPELIPLFQNRYMHEVEPHIFSLSEDTYRALLREKEDQCIIITGESGSGKTEASKKIMQYIAAVSGNSKEIIKVKEQLLKSNPVLEAFGNAKTLRNDNSSRFGKYLEIFFDGAGDPVGGKIRNFLLEKNRVVCAGQEERNFHIFYQLTRGCAGSLRDKYHLKEPEFYHYLSRTGEYDLSKNQGSDIDGWREMTDGLDSLGITKEDQDALFSTVSAILWIGQIQFEGDQDEARLHKDSDPFIGIIAGLLKVDENALRDCFTKRQIRTAGVETITRFLNTDEAINTRDALAKVIYSRMFEWIVYQINVAIRPKSLKKNTIGVLDIYGFEIFRDNSFEQFCINYVNEKLQQVFIERTLKIEQEEYTKEGIEWTPVEFFNNKIVCDMIEDKKSGILTILDEACLVPKGSDKVFHEMLIKHLSKHDHFEAPHARASHSSFLLNHYAGAVEYDTIGFVEKNKDLVWNDLLAIGESSELEIFKSMFPAPTENESRNKRPVTAGTAFKGQVNELMNTLQKCMPHYIRCIKPNDEKKAKHFDTERVSHQTTYLGLLQNVKVCRAGFAFRQPFEMFVRRYKITCPETWPVYSGAPVDGCKAILSHLRFKDGVDYQMGKSKIFIKDPQSLFELEHIWDTNLNRIYTDIQGLWKGFKARADYQIYRSAELIQATFKGYRKRDWYIRDRSATLIQSRAKGFLLREHGKLEKSGYVLTKVVHSFMAMKGPIRQKEMIKNKIRPHKNARKASLRAFPVKLYVPEITGVNVGYLENCLKKQRKNDSTEFMFVDVGEKLGKKNFTIRSNRVFVISQKALYEIEWKNGDKFTKAELNKAKKSPEPKLSFHRCFPLQDIQSVSMSTKADNMVVLHTKQKEGDYVFILERKSEFVTSLMIQTTGYSKFKINFTDEIHYSYKKHENILKFVDGRGDGVHLTPEPKSKPPLCNVTVGKT